MLASLLVTLATASCTLAAATLNPALTRSFFGLAYSPDGVLLPYCGAEQSQVTDDIILLAQMTPRIRLYASDCNQTALVLQAIQDTNADLSVHLGIYIDGNDTVYERQVDAIVDAISKYGTAHIAGITVGNEFLLQSYGDGVATDAAGIAARTELLAYIQTTNATLQALNLDKVIPLGTADAGSAVTTPLCAGADFVMANVHPWFGSVDAAGAAAWTTNFYKEFDTDVCALASNNPTMYIAETGWPTESDNASLAVNGADSPADLAGLQTFLDTFVCSSNENSTNYFFFEFKDETWKAIYGGVEQHWGLFYPNRTMKAVTIPTCEVTSPTGGTVAQLNLDAGSGSSTSGSSTSTGDSASSTSTSTNSNTGGAGRSASLGGPAWIIAAGALLVGLPLI
ncbi:glycoside hydrolase superfamily [Mrakia frigida]|uniref:glycoside hydrolase superfamily n=1 Tax=Mrakia frigida TaxID=29902 RepID=UPI003FCC03DB